MNAKTRAVELFNEHIALSTTDQTAFRRLVMNTLIAEFSLPDKPMSIAAAATHYNNAKKGAEAAGTVSGLGRTVTKVIDPDAVVATVGKIKKAGKAIVDDSACFTVIEVIDGIVCRCRSYLDIGEARDDVYDRREFSSFERWKLIQGLGPNSGETYRLRDDEKEIE